jgi:hypothetical protein
MQQRLIIRKKYVCVFDNVTLSDDCCFRRFRFALARRLLQGGVIGGHALHDSIHLDHLHCHPSSFSIVEDIVPGERPGVQHLEEGYL